METKRRKRAWWPDLVALGLGVVILAVCGVVTLVVRHWATPETAFGIGGFYFAALFVAFLLPLWIVMHVIAHRRRSRPQAGP